MNNTEKKEEALKKSCNILRFLCCVPTIILLCFTVWFAYICIVTFCTKDKVNSQEVTLQEQLLKQRVDEPDSIPLITDGFDTPFFETCDTGILIGFKSDLITHLEYKSRLDLAKEGTYYLYPAAGYALGFIQCADLTVAFWLIICLLSQIKKDATPFNQVTLRRLKWIFILFLLFNLIKGKIIGSIILALLLWCLYTMFDIGCSLQKQADETL